MSSQEPTASSRSALVSAACDCYGHAATKSDSEPTSHTLPTSVAGLKACLMDESEPIGKRTRCVFMLRQIGSVEAVTALAAGMRTQSVLLSHEAAFVLGQMKLDAAIPFLVETLKDESLDVITRHESAEALAAIGNAESIAVLRQFENDSHPELSDTCKLALDHLKWQQENKGSSEHDSKYLTVDPAPSYDVSTYSISQLQQLSANHLRISPARNIQDDEVILSELARRAGPNRHAAHAFVRAGVRESIVWSQGEVKAAIVTCGGLCPGLNDVIEEIVRILYYNYGVDLIYGICNGYHGFYNDEWKVLTPTVVRGIHLQGGTVLGSSRGGFDLKKILDAVETRGVNQIYIIGGDGTHRAADELFREISRRSLKISVAAVPKTIDNDIGIIDRSFGFHTAIAEAQKAILSAQVEARCTPNGIGIVKLMGRESGMIAAHSTIASRQVDLCLIPEIQFEMSGEHGILAYLEQVLEERHHAVIVVAEGAGQELIKEISKKTDPSGNKKLPEIGKFISMMIEEHFSSKKIPVSIKYHDPSYMIRSVASIASDSIYCMTLAQNVVHGAMAGYTGFTSAMVNNRTVYLPIKLIADVSPTRLNPTGRTWERVVSSTHQPSFKPK